jgi:hypothetical protein
MRIVAKALKAAVVGSSLIVVAGSCGDTITEPNLGPQVRMLQVFPNPAVVRVDEALVMVVTMAADSGANTALTWTSADPRRVSVSETGIITGVSVGPAVVTVQSVGNPALFAAVPVTVTPAYTGVHRISASPSSLTLIPGQTQAIAAVVDADSKVSRDVRFEIDSTSVATVTTAGLVTAVAPGSARVVVRSTVDASITAVVGVTVRAPSPAQISIQALTSGGTSVPVNLESVRGQVDAVVNVTIGEAALDRVDLVATNNGRDTVVASQNYSSALAAARARLLRSARSMSDTARIAAELAPIVLSFRTNAFNATSGAVSLRNGATTLKAVAVHKPGAGTTTQQQASNGIAFHLSNLDGFVVSVRGLSNTGIASATDANGRRWMQAGRGLVFTSLPIAFSGRQVGGRTISFPGDNPIASISSTKSGESVDTLMLPATFASAVTGAAYINGELPSITSADQSGASMDLVPSTSSVVGGSGAGVINAQATYQSGTRLDGIRVDNAPPPAATFVISSSQQNVNNWVNGAYKFTSGLTGIAPDVGVGLVGSNTSPTAESMNATILVIGGDLTDTTEAQTGSQLPPSNTNTAYVALARYADRLGNTRVVPLAANGVHPRATFGVDLQAPTVRYTPTALTTETLVTDGTDSVFASLTGLNGPMVFAIDAIDDRSGLADGRVGITLKRFAQPNPVGTFNGTTTCVIGVNGTCGPAYQAYENVLTDQFRQVTIALDGGSALEGYYTFSATAQDQAGNVSAPRTKQALYDKGSNGSAPSLTGLGVSGVLVGGQPAAFIALAVDNVELARGGVVVTYPNLPTSQMLTYHTVTSGGVAIGTAFDASLTSPVAGTHAAFTMPNFIRGLESVSGTDAPQAYPASTAKPTSVTGWVRDFAPNNPASSLATPAPIPASSVQSPTSAMPGFAAGVGTSNELQFWRRVGTTGMAFEAIGPSGQANLPFARVLLARLEPSGFGANADVWHVVSELTTPVGTDNGLRRAWTYDFGSQSGGSYVAIGISAAGDAIVTRVITF